MRDLLIFLIVFGSVPMIMKRAWTGILVWSWLGYMNPHRLTWSFAYDFPFAQVIALVTLVALLFSAEKKKFPITPTTLIWLFWVFWMNVTTVITRTPGSSLAEWDRAMKIQLISLVTVMVMGHRDRIVALVWVIAMSLAFFGVKGGIFSILTGGEFHVFGPSGSFIQGNNSIGLALVMTMPLLWYLFTRPNHWTIRIGLLAAMPLTALAILTTQSRGAFLAISAMVVFLWLKSRHKLWLGLAIILVSPLILMNMPEEWFDRMRSISAYEEDGSALGRINAWWFAFNLALDHPFVGGGFHAFSPRLFQRYAPNPDDFHDSHSIYFEVLGEHGFVGLALFLSFGLAIFLTGSLIIRRAAKHEQLTWIRDLAAMLQVSLVGYAVGGAFLGLAYFDLLYHVAALLVLLKMQVQQFEAANVVSTDPPARGMRAQKKPPATAPRRPVKRSANAKRSGRRRPAL